MKLKSKNLQRKTFIEIIKKDKFVRTLFLSNLFITFFALYEHWDLFELVFGYFIQSLIIGFFTIIEILNMKRFLMGDLEELILNDRKAERGIHKLLPANQPRADMKTKIYASSMIILFGFINTLLINFVLLIYFMLNTEYLISIPTGSIYSVIPFLFVFNKMKTSALIIFISLLILYILNRMEEKNDIDKETSILSNTIKQFNYRVVVQFYISVSFFLFWPLLYFNIKYTYIIIIIFFLLKSFFDIEKYLEKDIIKG